MISPLVNESTALATAATTYDTGTTSAGQARWQTLAGTDNSQSVTNGLYQADILNDWTNSLASIFDTFQTNMAQDEADLDKSLTDAEDEESRSLADADVAELTGSQTNSETYRTGELTLSQAYDTATTTADEEWDVDSATGDKNLDIDRATAQKTRRIARATAERDYQIALAQAEVFDGSDNSAALQTAENNHTAGLADAEMNYTIDLADADVTWTDAEALADKTDSDTWAAAEDTYEVGVAGLDRTYLTSQTATDNTYETSVASAESTRITADDTASTLFNTNRNTAEETYLTGDYSARLASLTNLNNTANLPYTSFLVSEATAEQTAWQNVETDYETTTTNINTATATYDTLVANQTTSLATSETTAEAIYIGSVAPAVETRDINDANAWELYDQNSADAEETYQQAMATATRNHKVALAQAERDLTVNGDQAAYDTAVATADDDFEAAQLMAARDYAFAELGAEGQRDTSLQSAESTLDSTAGTAEITRVQSLTSAIHDAEIADATAYAEMLMNIADDLASLDETQANDLQTELANLAANDGTPWANQASARATAEYNFLVASNSADHTRLSTETTAQVAFSTSEADAWQTRTNAETEAQVDLINDQDTARSTYLTSEYGNEQTGANLGLQPVNLSQSFDPNAPVLSAYSSSTTANTASVVSAAEPSEASVSPAVTLPPSIEDPEQPEEDPVLNLEAFIRSTTAETTDASFLPGTVTPQDGIVFPTNDPNNKTPQSNLGEATDPKTDGFDPETALAGIVPDYLGLLRKEAERKQAEQSKNELLPPFPTKTDSLEEYRQRLAMEHLRKIKNTDLWRELRAAESKWAGFDQLSEIEKDGITSLHYELVQNIEKMINKLDDPKTKAASVAMPSTFTGPRESLTQREISEQILTLGMALQILPDIPRDMIETQKQLEALKEANRRGPGQISMLDGYRNVSSTQDAVILRHGKNGQGTHGSGSDCQHVAFGWRRHGFEDPIWTRQFNRGTHRSRG